MYYIYILLHSNCGTVILKANWNSLVKYDVMSLVFFLSKSINYLPTCIYPWIKLRKNKLSISPAREQYHCCPERVYYKHFVRKSFSFWILCQLSEMLLFDGELYSNACRRFFSQKEIFFLTILKFFLKSLLVIIIHNLQQQKFLTILQYFSNCNQKIQISQYSHLE